MSSHDSCKMGEGFQKKNIFSQLLRKLQATSLKNKRDRQFKEAELQIANKHETVFTPAGQHGNAN